jgi:hypothetical protein
MDQSKVSQYIRARKRDNPSSSYESVVKSRIQQNQQLLVSLGFNRPICDQLAQVHKRSHIRKHNSRREKTTKASIPIRKSKRLAGESPSEDVDVSILEEFKYEMECPQQTTSPHGPSTAKCYDPENIATPYTLKSIKTTVYHLGAHVGIEDPNAFDFLSHDSCKFKHPYPIGYRAVKREFGRIWLMGIERQENAGPIFFIQPLEEHEEDELFQGNQIPMDGRAYTGYAPTWPWTQACLKSKSPGRRISGPLYFGFSDPLNVCKVMSLEGGHEILSRYQERFSKDSCKRIQIIDSSSQNMEE